MACRKTSSTLVSPSLNKPVLFVYSDGGQWHILMCVKLVLSLHWAGLRLSLCSLHSTLCLLLESSFLSIFSCNSLILASLQHSHFFVVSQKRMGISKSTLVDSINLWRHCKKLNWLVDMDRAVSGNHALWCCTEFPVNHRATVLNVF